MSASLNKTHDPNRRSWVAAANDPASDFPIQNLPFGVFSVAGSPRRGGVAIGDQIVDLDTLADSGLLSGLAQEAATAAAGPTLNEFLALGPKAWSALRLELCELLTEGHPATEQLQNLLVPQAKATLHLPMQIGDYTDFYASVFHATNIGSMFRPDNPLLPNYKYVPIGYHGRASSIVASGAPVRRPYGQLKGPQDDAPAYKPSALLDYELEVGLVVGPGNALGERIAIDAAERHIFGLCLVNDWSARDIQAWEYQPLGPFLAKNFVTTIAPWIVTLEALAPYRVPAFARPEGDPAPLPYLQSERDQAQGGVDLTLEVALRTPAMRAADLPAERISRGSFRDMYWTLAQLVTHHTSNGCPIQPGDLLASGTVSGPEPEARGCLMELTWRGKEPLKLANGEERGFLEDGDEVIISGYCAREGQARIGFGTCSGIVIAAES